MKTAKQLELSLLVKELHVQQLQKDLNEAQELSKYWEDKYDRVNILRFEALDYIKDNIDLKNQTKFIENIVDILEGKILEDEVIIGVYGQRGAGKTYYERSKNKAKNNKRTRRNSWSS